jgi:hypothetical protein
MDPNSLISACYSLHNERQELLKTLKTDEEIEKWRKDTLHFFRIEIEPYVFNYLNHTYGHKLDEFWKTHQFSKEYKYAFVIVERRVHPNWWFILRNILWAAPNFSLYIFCSDVNYDFIKSILGDKAENVHICQWFKGIADREKGFTEYNITFKLPQFYKLIKAEYFITVQMDSYFLQKIPDWIFTGTYYGAPWAWNPTMAGNGGLSIRNVKNMIELCEKEIQNIQNNEGEDWHFSQAIVKYNYVIPPFEFRCKVIQENFPVDLIPIGTHQFWTYINNYNLSDKPLFMNYINKLITLIGL